MKHLDEIRILVDEKKPHILCLNKTKIDSSIADDNFGIEDYALKRKDQNCVGGGVAIYVHKSIRFKERVDLRKIELELDLQAISETISGDRALRNPDKFTRRGDTPSELKANNLPPRCISISGGLKIFCLDVNSLMKHLDEISILVDEKKPHILCLNKTKIDSSIADDNFGIEDYALKHKDQNCVGGGVAIYVHKSIRFKERVDLRKIELETITIELNIPFVKPIILNTIYRLEGPVEVFNKIESLISKIISEKRNLSFCMI